MPALQRRRGAEQAAQVGAARAGALADLVAAGAVTPQTAGVDRPVQPRAQFARQQTAMVMRQDFIRGAIARGLPARVVYGRHLLRNVAIPLVTFAGVILVQILGGVVVVETLFAIPGLGRTLLGAIQARDYPVLQGALLVAVLIALLVNLLVDLLYAAIDPRVRGA